MRASGMAGKPQAVSLEITHRCIAKCIMCNIWRIPRNTPELSVKTWLSLLSRELFADLVELDITGGEPFLRGDLADLLTGACRLKKDHLVSLKSIAVTTNGFLTRRILDQCQDILPEARHADIDIVMVCAMDAVGEVHDRIRNYPGGWRRVDETIQGLKQLQTEFPNLVIGLKTTVLPLNVGQLDALVQYAKKHDLFTIISPCIITRGRYLNPNLADALAFMPEQIQEMIRFFKTEASGWSFHDDCLVRFFQTGRMKKPCSCGFNYFFIRSQGALFPCPIIDTSPGNVMETDIETLLASDEAADFRRHVGRFPECHSCTEPGLERYSLPCEGWTYLFLLPKMGKKRFFDMHHHMGLYKYFT